MEPDPAVIAELVRRIGETVHPLRVILFGSAARGTMGPDSDIDVLVVVQDGVHRRRTAQKLHMSMFGLPAAVDILVATPSDLEKHKDNMGLIYHQVLREGRDLYAA